MERRLERGMQVAMRKFISSTIVIIVLATQSIGHAGAGNRFTSSYSCSDAVKTCVSSGTRIVDGFSVTKDCWEWSYYKTCNYPSRDDCRKFSHCYAVADLPCLLRDNYGNCVNLQKEFSCKSWEPVTIDKEMVRIGLVEKEGKERLVCKGVPCIDGNCVDKSYLTDGDMMDSVSKLYAVSEMKGALDLNFKLFAGFGQSCSKKATSYTNCCSTSLKGWGKNLGAKCTKDEIDLVDKRQKNLCVYVGKQNKQTMGITTVVKHHYCCFGSLLNKVIQVEGRKQLGINFGSGGRTDCRGLTLAEIMQLDFDKMDFSEFFQDILKRMKIPKVGDISSRVNSSLPNVRKYDGNPNNKKNNMTGWNADVKDDSWEADEERRLEAERQERERLAQLELERLEQERLAQLERERLEQERLAAIERERLAALEMERVRVVAGRELLAKKRIELIAAEKEYQRRIEYWNREGNYLYKYHGLGAEWTKVANQSYVVRDLKYEVQVLENSWGR
jgi:Type-1V conjugative transfer system mating pair stabilisation